MVTKEEIIAKINLASTADDIENIKIMLDEFKATLPTQQIQELQTQEA